MRSSKAKRLRKLHTHRPNPGRKYGGYLKDQVNRNSKKSEEDN